MSKSYLSIVSDGTFGNTRITVVDPDTGKEIEVERIIGLNLEIRYGSPASAVVEVMPRSVTVEAADKDVSWHFDCPVCSENVTHECRPPDFVTTTATDGDAKVTSGPVGIGPITATSLVALPSRRGLPPEPPVPMSVAMPRRHGKSKAAEDATESFRRLGEAFRSVGAAVERAAHPAVTISNDTTKTYPTSSNPTKQNRRKSK